MNNNNKTDDKTDDIIRREREREREFWREKIRIFLQRKERDRVADFVKNCIDFSFFLLKCNGFLLNWVQIVFYFFLCVNNNKTDDIIRRERVLARKFIFYREKEIGWLILVKDWFWER